MSGWSVEPAIAAIDAANAHDPNLIDGRPRALVQGELASKWLARLDPAASPALALAVRAHHLRRWAIPRDDYPAGRGGYLRWRRDLKAVHAESVAHVLRPVGVDPATIERTQQLVRKDGLGPDRHGLGRDAEAQTFEDVVCLVFLETQFEDLVERLDDEPKMLDVLRKTIPKMSPAALALAGDAHVPPRAAALLAKALEPPA
jgi:hypothetical protein